MKSVDYQIIMIPTSMDFDCPECYEGFSIPWKDAVKEYGDDIWYGDLGTFICPECDCEFELDELVND